VWRELARAASYGLRRAAKRQTRSIGLVAVPFCLLASSAQGADPRLVEAGREIVEGAGIPPDFACQRCHGTKGEGKPSEDAPRLAGQPRFYLEKQLGDFVDGTRRSEKMTPVARALSEEQREAAAAYYASLYTVPYPEAPDGDPTLVRQGGILSAIGDADREIGACEICHADVGVGIAPSFPYIAGQYADYTERQLRAWKQGTRRNDPLDVMAEIAERLSDEEIRALALYFARVRPPSESLSSPIPAEPVPPPPETPSVPD
jgi:cytochrome c553